jgi:hypothetical protein
LLLLILITSNEAVLSVCWSKLVLCMYWEPLHKVNFGVPSGFLPLFFPFSFSPFGYLHNISSNLFCVFVILFWKLTLVFSGGGQKKMVFRIPLLYLIYWSISKGPWRPPGGFIWMGSMKKTRTGESGRRNLQWSSS